MCLAAAAKMEQQQWNTEKHADVDTEEIFFHTALIKNNWGGEPTVDECQWD